MGNHFILKEKKTQRGKILFSAHMNTERRLKLTPTRIDTQKLNRQSICVSRELQLKLRDVCECECVYWLGYTAHKVNSANGNEPTQKCVPILAVLLLRI